MARVTVEDCIEKVPNRFELVLLASQRAKQLSSGAMLTIDRDRDKNPVVALREIAEGTITPDSLKETVIRGWQRRVQVEENEEDLDAILAQDALLDPGEAGGLGSAAIFDAEEGGLFSDHEDDADADGEPTGDESGDPEADADEDVA